MKPRVSVIIPTYNGSRYLETAVRSILLQSLREFELIIFDDGSDDGTLRLANYLAAEDERIRVFSRPNRGLVATTNESLELAQCEFVALMDHDDVSEPYRLSAQYELLWGSAECVIVGGQLLYIDPDGLPLMYSALPLHHGDIDRGHFDTGSNGVPQALLPNSGSMMRRSVALRLGGFRKEFEFAQDLDMLLRLAEVGELANLAQPVLRYRVRLDSAGTVNLQKQRDAAVRAVLEACNRRGIADPNLLAGAKNSEYRVQSVEETFRMWGWWALSSGFVSSARTYALRSLVRNPVNVENWRLLACSLRGY